MIYKWIPTGYQFIYFFYFLFFVKQNLWLSQGKFVCIAQLRHKATQSALQDHKNGIKIH